MTEIQTSQILTKKRQLPSIPLLGIEGLLKRRAEEIESITTQLQNVKKQSDRRGLVASASKNYLSARNCLNGYIAASFLIYIPIHIFGLEPLMPKIAVHLVDAVILTFFSEACKKQIKQFEKLQLDLWQAGGVASIPDLISFIPKRSRYDASEHGLALIKMLSNLLRQPGAIDFISSDEKIRLSRYANRKLPPKKMKLKFELQRLQQNLKDLKRAPKDMWTND